MSIELDWDITEEGNPPSGEPAPAHDSKPRRPRRRVPRRVFIAIGLTLVALIAAVGLYVFSVYRKQVERVEREIRPVAKQEAQAIAQNDRELFLALQDPQDDAWRAMQTSRFGKLERDGLPEFGWKSTGFPPQPGQVTLEPGGARLDVTYKFSVTNPLPNGPASITLRVPQFYRQTPSGWVRANGTIEYWGTWRSHSGQHFAMRYTRRDADILEPLIPRMDELLARVCGPLPCPPQPIYLIFENSPDSLARLSDSSSGFDEGNFILKLPSPHLTGMPTDARSRDELYRAIGTRVVQALVSMRLASSTSLNSFPDRLLLKWELSKAGLDGPFITPQITQTLAAVLQTGEWQSLVTIPLRSRSAAAVTEQDVALTSLALAFLEQQQGPGAVERLIPVAPPRSTRQFNFTLGEMIRAVWQVNPLSLEPEWLTYLRQQAGLPLIRRALPSGELALTCAMTRENSALVSISVDGMGTRQIASGRSVSSVTWSPDGKRLAFLQNNYGLVWETGNQQIKPVREGYRMAGIGWLPDGRLLMQESSGTESRLRAINLTTGQDSPIVGMSPVWSPNGQWMAYLVVRYPITQTLWLATADGNDERPLALGYGTAWSPDSQRLAFMSGSFSESSIFNLRLQQLNEISIADISSGQVKTLARMSELVSSSTGRGGEGLISQLAWSPDGSLLAAVINQDIETVLVVLDANTGQVRTHWRGTSVRWISMAWSADSRYLGFWTMPAVSSRIGTVGTLNAATGQTITLPGRDFDWSPDGQWLAVPQDPDGIFLIAPDLSAMRWLDTPNCSNVAWRPYIR